MKHGHHRQPDPIQFHIPFTLIQPTTRTIIGDPQTQEVRPLADVNPMPPNDPWHITGGVPGPVIQLGWCFWWGRANGTWTINNQGNPIEWVTAKGADRIAVDDTDSQRYWVAPGQREASLLVTGIPNDQHRRCMPYRWECDRSQGGNMVYANDFNEPFTTKFCINDVYDPDTYRDNQGILTLEIYYAQFV